MNTIYSSNGLVLVSVTMFWGVALKLVRYQKEDPTDIVAMLRHGTKLNGVHWTPLIMENWIKTLCWPMGYDSYQPQRIGELRERIQDAVRLLQTPSDDLTLGKSFAPTRRRRHSTHVPHEHHMQSSHTPPHIQPLPTSFDLAIVPHRSFQHDTSSRSSSSSSMQVPMHHPWFHHGPVVPHTMTRAF